MLFRLSKGTLVKLGYVHGNQVSENPKKRGCGLAWYDSRFGTARSGVRILPTPLSGTLEQSETYLLRQC